MSSRLTVEVLADVAARVLEDMAFLFTVLSADAAPWPDGAVEATLSFHGPERWEIRIRTSPELASRLAADMLGVEPGDPEALGCAGDAVGELLNVVAGALAERVFGAEAVCRLGVPRPGRALDEGRPSHAVSLATDDDQRVELAVFAEG
jgi:hypothetical protein